ncbi:MAG: hypothetical protein PHQ32_04465 [Firmicutes bacterium]|nr:hypothetical protein [Bacillota bacterium]
MFLSRIKDLKNIYSIDSKDDFIIDLQLDRYRDVYSDWDYSPYQNRDLDDDLVEYLLECSYEIGHHYKMKVLFHLPKMIKDKNKELVSIKGIRHFFAYQYKRNKTQMLRVIRDTLIFFLLGILMITIGTILKNSLTINLFNQVLIEGLYIGGWVMMWEMFSTWFFQVNKYRNKIKHFKRLQNIEYEYFYTDVEI